MEPRSMDIHGKKVEKEDQNPLVGVIDFCAGWTRPPPTVGLDWAATLAAGLLRSPPRMLCPIHAFASCHLWLWGKVRTSLSSPYDFSGSTTPSD